MKQITLKDEQYGWLLEKIHENTYGYGLTHLERVVMENTKYVESEENKDHDRK